MIIAYLSLFTKVFKTNRKKPTIAVSNYVEQNNENEEVNIEKLIARIAEIVIQQQKLRENIDEVVVDSGRGFSTRKFVRMMATCRNFRKLWLFGFSELPRMFHNSLRRVSQIQLFGNSGQLALQFAVLKNNIVDHFRNLTEVVEFDHFKNGEFATINAK